MKISTLKFAIVAAIVASAGPANAALTNGLTLDMTRAPTGGIVQPASGSYFSMLALDTTLNGVPDTTVYIPIASFNGIRLGTTQTASGSHSGAVNGTENPDIDDPWGFFGNTGMHQTTSNSNVLSASGNTATVDFSGWNVTWNGIAGIPMGSGAWGGNADGVADITCAVDCSYGDTYTLDYTATVPLGDPSNFGGVSYGLHLEGSVVPVPAAVWLFGSGLLGLVGVARRRKAA